MCCYEDRILDGCSDFRNDGYRFVSRFYLIFFWKQIVLKIQIQIQFILFFFSCVQKDKCETNALGIRFSNADGALDGLLEGLFVSKAENASCPDIDTICCNELDVKITIDTNLDACTDFENDGYRFVSSFYLVEFKIWMPGYSWNSKFHFKFNGKAKILTCITVSEVCSTDWKKRTLQILRASHLYTMANFVASWLKWL